MNEMFSEAALVSATYSAALQEGLAIGRREAKPLLEALEKCYRELNEIHARDGVPYTYQGWKSSVQQEYFTGVVEQARDAIAAYLKAVGK